MEIYFSIKCLIFHLIIVVKTPPNPGSFGSVKRDLSEHPANESNMIISIFVKIDFIIIIDSSNKSICYKRKYPVNYINSI